MTLRAHISVQRTVIDTLNECSMLKGCELIEEKVKWKGNFLENLYENCGRPPEVVHFFRSERNSGNSLTFIVRSSTYAG